MDADDEQMAPRDAAYPPWETANARKKARLRAGHPTYASVPNRPRNGRHLSDTGLLFAKAAAQRGGKAASRTGRAITPPRHSA